MRAVTSGWGVVLVMFGCLLCGQQEWPISSQEVPCWCGKSLAYVSISSMKCSDGGKQRKVLQMPQGRGDDTENQKGVWRALSPFSPGAGNSSLVSASSKASESWLLKYLEAN